MFEQIILFYYVVMCCSLNCSFIYCTPNLPTGTSKVKEPEPVTNSVKRLSACVCVCVCLMQEMAHAWEEYSRLENSVEQLRLALQAQMNHSASTQVKPVTACQSRAKLALDIQLKHTV